MTQTHRFTEPAPVMDLSENQRTFPRDVFNDPIFREGYERWLDERDRERLLGERA